MEIPLRKLRVVLAVHECGSISAAAEALHISQPAASRALAGVEAALGAELFERTGRGMRPTEAGRALAARLARARGLLAAAGAGVTAAADREVEAALAVAKAGSVSGAARQLGLTQPALSRSLRRLEHRLGTPLFERLPGEMRTTREGARLVLQGRLALAEIRQAREEVEALAGRRGGTLRIGALPLTRVRLVPLAVERLLQDFPAARVAVVDGGYGALYPALLHGELDMLVGTLRPARPREVLAERLFDDDVAIVARSGHPLARRRRVSLEDALAFPWVLPFGSVPLRIWFEETLAQAGLPAPERVVEADSIVVVRSLLLASDRIAALSRHQVAPEVELGLLRLLPVPLAPAPRPVGILRRADHLPTPLARACMEAMRQVAAEIAGSP